MAIYKITTETQRKGGDARALALSPRRRREIARAAAQARWGKKNDKKAKAA